MNSGFVTLYCPSCGQRLVRSMFSDSFVCEDCYFGISMQSLADKDILNTLKNKPVLKDKSTTTRQYNLEELDRLQWTKTSLGWWPNGIIDPEVLQQLINNTTFAQQAERIAYRAVVDLVHLLKNVCNFNKGLDNEA